MSIVNSRIVPPGKLIDLAAFFWSNGRVPAETTSFVFFGSDEGAAASAAAAAYGRLEEGGDGWGNEIIDGAAATVDEAVEIVGRTISGLQMLNMCPQRGGAGRAR